MSFLKAEWKKLALANYEVDPIILKPFIPGGTEIDFWEGKCYISLVGFMFINTRLLGIKVPGHVNFEEVNLRFYVRTSGHESKRGVVFIKEIVPKPAITFVANTIYKENYQTLPMRHDWMKKEGIQSINYEWRTGSKWNNFQVYAAIDGRRLIPESVEQFITEHYWGYSKQGDKTHEYEVRHPSWLVYEVNDWNIDVDFKSTYGNQFAFLSNVKPTSVMLAEGSEISVESKQLLKHQ